MKVAKTSLPILVIAFKRPAALKRLLEQLNRIWTGRLYISIDSAKPSEPLDIEKQSAVVEIANSIDWAEQKSVRISEENLGCRFGPVAAINWFFSQEEEGVILEDDCIPEGEFLDYCQWALSEFRDNKRVWHIAGNNFSAPREYFDRLSCAFIPIAQVWGWATWSDRWSKYIDNPFWVETSAIRNLAYWKLSRVAKLNKLRHLEQLKRGLDTWDYQWQCCVLNGQGLAVVPAGNLITNIGDGPDASHTKQDNRVRLQTRPISVPLERYQMELNSKVLAWFERNMGLRNKLGTLVYIVHHSSRVVRRFTRILFCSIFFFRSPRIVVASSGRSGSTLLATTLAAGLVENRFPYLPRLLRSYLSKLAVDFESRLSHGSVGQFPITKTHDYYENARSKPLKFIFVFGDPLESALSVLNMTQEHGQSWLDEHLFNLGSNGNCANLVKKDVLCYERQLSSWSALSDDILTVYYEDLWEYSEYIQAFSGIKCTFPGKTARSAKSLPEDLDLELFTRLRKMMTNLRDASQRKKSLTFHQP